MKVVCYITIIIGLIILGFSKTYGIWSLLQDTETQGAGNVNYSGYITLPLYLTTYARDEAIRNAGDRKYKVYGGAIRYGINKNFDFSINGNYSINSSIGIGLKYRIEKHFATICGIDYILNEMVLSPSGAVIATLPLNKNFSLYGGLKAFYWQNFYVNQTDRRDHFDLVLSGGLHIFRKEGFRDIRVLSFLPLGVYLELGYPINLGENALTVSLGLDGFLGFSLPKI
ncbi:MAG: hypothetical protein NZ601_05690 [candidate division WOR-3 bacterium]|nr:hypothetical protein [candidate division WOR-3 bacterium]MCX7757534.1 hypothetical protein [candidate division WOR-3 bacterium]MDW7987683.1 hypothetical protein [candidate division WOR-3 bacterium]